MPTSPWPTADAADLRDALALVAADQWATEARELNLIKFARDRKMSWRDIAWSLGLDSPQAAEKRFQRLTRPPETLIYAFRVAESDGPWYGKLVARLRIASAAASSRRLVPECLRGLPRSACHHARPGA